MNDQLKCCIVKDLLPSYIENLTSSETKEAIEVHMKNCEKCRKQYSLMKGINKRKDMNENEEENIEYNHLKKYNKKMSCIKITMSITIIFILIIVSIIAGNYMYKKDILNRIYNNYTELKSLDNYIIMRKTLDVYYNTNEMGACSIKYYYKDGKMKKEVRELSNIEGFKKDISQYSQIKATPNDITEYSDINNKKMVTIYDSRKEYSEGEQQFHTNKGELFNIQFDTDAFNIWFFPYIIQIKNQKYNETEYYILQYNFTNNNEYKQIWVNKKNLNIEKVIEVGEKYYRESIYEIIKDTTTDNDLLIPSLEDYKNVTER